MIETIINPHFRIRLDDKETRNATQIIRDIKIVATNLIEYFKQHSDKKCEIEIYLDSMYDFIIALFGGFLANTEVYILSTNKPSNKRLYINDINPYLTQKNTLDSIDSSDIRHSKFYIQTSGSSGEGKSILKTLDCMILESKCLATYLHIDKSHTIISSVSHNHLYGLSFKVFLPLTSGASVESSEFVYPEMIFSYANDYRDILFITSPTLLNVLCKYSNLRDLQSLNAIISAGSKLESSTKKTLENAFKTAIPTIIEIYGSTETGVIARNSNKENSHLSKEDSRFIIFDGVKVALNSENKLIISSPWQQNIYCKDSFISNDCAIIDNDNITLLGRSDRIIKLHDKRISLDCIEQTLKNHESIDDCIVINNNTSRLSAIIVLSKMGETIFRSGGREAIVSTLKAYLKPEFGSILRYFCIRENLPYNAQGKITKDDLSRTLCAKITPIFDIIQQSDTNLTAKAYISPACFYFDGHFPRFPLVPGFVELGFVVEQAKILGIKTQDIIEIQSAKWTLFLRPFDTLTLVLSTQSNKIIFKLYANDKECANGKLILRR